MIIAFSGTDGAGKSTQIQRLRQSMESAGRSTLQLWARGGYTPLMLVGKKLALRLLGRKGNSSGFDKKSSGSYIHRREGLIRRPIVARTWLSIAIIDMMIFYGAYARFHSCRGTVVICDRYLGDTKIDFQRNFPRQFNPRGPLWRLLEIIAPKPAAHLLLTVPVHVSLERSRMKNEPFPDDPETLAFRYRAYKRMDEFSQDSVTPIDAIRSVDEIAADILAVVGKMDPSLAVT